VLSRNHCRREKAISITYSNVLLVALLIRHAKLVRRIMLLTVSTPALPYFSTLSDKRQDFREKKNVTEYKMSVLSLHLLSEKKNFILRRILQDTTINVHYAFMFFVILISTLLIFLVVSILTTTFSIHY
jgi:hypothetical protein